MDLGIVYPTEAICILACGTRVWAAHVWLHAALLAAFLDSFHIQVPEIHFYPETQQRRLHFTGSL